MATKTMKDYLSVVRADTHRGQLTVDATAGFQVGERVVGGTSGASGIVRGIVSGTILDVEGPNTGWTNGETVTGQTSSTTATVSSYSDLAASAQPALTVAPQNVLVEDISRKGVVREFDDGSEGRIELSTDPVFRVQLQWSNLSEADAGTIFDYYNNPDLGRGMLRTFYWQHPTEGTLYTVRWEGSLARSLTFHGFFGFQQAVLKVLGYYA